MDAQRRNRRIWFATSAALLVLGVVIGLILQNVWLGLLLAAIVSLVGFFGLQSRRGGNTGVNDESQGIEL